eukprot:494348-Prorocentrum_minimum.AAC.2
MRAVPPERRRCITTTTLCVLHTAFPARDLVPVSIVTTEACEAHGRKKIKRLVLSFFSIRGVECTLAVIDTGGPGSASSSTGSTGPPGVTTD